MQKTQETRVRSLSWEDPLEKGMAAHSNILLWRILVDRGAWQLQSRGSQESDTTERTEHAWKGMISTIF